MLCLAKAFNRKRPALSWVNSFSLLGFADKAKNISTQSLLSNPSPKPCPPRPNPKPKPKEVKNPKSVYHPKFVS